MTTLTTLRNIAVLTLAALSPGAAGAQGGFGARDADLAIVDQFDADDNGWLDRNERDAARAVVADRPAGPGGRGRRGGGPGPVGAGNGTPGERVDPADVTPIPAEVSLYADEAFRTIFFEFERDDWEAELALFHDTDVEIPATMIVDGVSYDGVGVRFRGNSSYRSVPAGLKRSFNVTVDYIVEEQDLLGYRTLNLLNGINDPSMLRGVLYQRIANAYLPSAKANFVRVVVNGESWGVYQNLEQINRDFVDDRFAGENGVRWKVPGSPGSRAGLEYIGDDPAAYRSLFEIKNKDNARSWEALINLTKVLNTTPADQLEAALEPILDVDEVLRFLALDIVLANSDGYWVRGSDYYLYLDEHGRFHVLPGDTNETFSAGRGGGRRGGRAFRPATSDAGPEAVGNRRAGPGAARPGADGASTLDLLTGLDDPTKPLRSRLLAVPSLRERYLAYCRDIADTWLDWSRLGAAAQQYHDLIGAAVEADTRKLVTTEQFRASLEGLRTFVEARRAYVASYAGP